MIHHLPRYPLFLLLLLLAASGCDGSSERTAFDDKAFAAPEGITRTTAEGAVVEADADDWQIAPGYRGRIAVEPAYPNPTGGQFLTIDLRVDFADAVRGQLGVFRYDEETGRLTFLEPVPEATTPGFYSVTIPSAALDPNRTQRLILLDQFDGGDAIVTYGDVRISE